MIQPERIKPINQHPVRQGQYVLYWMQASQRASWNHALEYAILRANELRLPVVVSFFLTGSFPGANLRHYTFMLEGLCEVERELGERGIGMITLCAEPHTGAMALARNASMVITDRGYLRIQREWRHRAGESVPCALIQVESDVIVPVETASGKEEYSAGTLRPKLHRLLPEYLVPLTPATPVRDSIELELPLPPGTVPLDLSRAVMNGGKEEIPDLDTGVPPVDAYHGGISRARALLDRFISDRLPHYQALSAHPELDLTSRLSPYLHFGQISPLDIAFRLLTGEEHHPGQETSDPPVSPRGHGHGGGSPARAGYRHSTIRDDTGIARRLPALPRQGEWEQEDPNIAAFLEQLIVRRELAVNFTEYNPAYDGYESAVHAWARASLHQHRNDPRPHRYSLGELENAETHDPSWNAAQRELLVTGHMHNYMRMYWGKKILEWTETPKLAFDTALYLNNRYQLDGRDQNGFAGVAWCFGRHDRAWKEREVFGKVRYMNRHGLERKFTIERYEKRYR